MQEVRSLEETRGEYLDSNIRFWAKNLAIHQVSCSVLFLFLSLAEYIPLAMKGFLLLLIAGEIPVLLLIFKDYRNESNSEILRKAEGAILNITVHILLLLYFSSSSVVPLMLAGISLSISLLAVPILRLDCNSYPDLNLSVAFGLIRLTKLITYVLVCLKIENLLNSVWFIILLPLIVLGTIILGISLGFIVTIVFKVIAYSRSLISKSELLGSIMIVGNIMVTSSVVIYTYFALEIKLETQMIQGKMFIFPLVTYSILALQTIYFQELITYGIYRKILVKGQCWCERLDYKHFLDVKEIPLKNVFAKRISEHYYEITKNSCEDNQDAKIEECTICCEKPSDCIIMSCGHRCICKDCGINLKIYGKSCPLCRGNIDYLYEVSDLAEVKVKIMIEGELL